MGGGGGYSLPPGDLKKLEEKAKEKLKNGEKTKRNVFISFAYEDIDEVNLLRAQAKNEKSNLEFSDYSVKEPFNSKNADYIRRKIKEKIEKVSVTVVYISEHTVNSKWVEWEVEQSLKMGKTVIAVHKGDTPPSTIPDYIKKNKIKIVKWKDLSNLL